ncbi:RNA polymerase sigma factor [Pseudomarimonas salicorniae]|uniref:Sigma-70 family RNA polymerase sigma factor n=1 Tax=Pseudomarimonas salicorniae TaxID=2933270 RepID=A0ABT0GJ49_9GAMM|nr:sigma-70 family RNA polymerase sigma factor [Lysobacter sp. CAU 1642]MCK7594377.1 sigma-70 family RNA polymerase sigma factor [Lysobacter sp. CAU 1642]
MARRPQAFERLVTRHQRMVWSLVYRMVQNRQDCEDLCQEVFLRVHRYLGGFRYDASLSTWIGQIAFSVAGRHLERRKIAIAEHGDDQVDPLDHIAAPGDLEADLMRADLGQRIEAALVRLSPIQRTLITLYHLEELSITEIAEITGQPPGTVKNYLFRARAALRGYINQDMGVAA